MNKVFRRKNVEGSALEYDLRDRLEWRVVGLCWGRASVSTG